MKLLVAAALTIGILVGYGLIEERYGQTALAAPSYLQTEQVDPELNLLAAERVIIGVDFALDAVGHAIANADNARVAHEQMRDTAKKLPGVRAIIALGPDGYLKYDSYQFPAQKLDLSDRGYFRAARGTSELVIGPTVRGRTSGTEFLPLAKRIGELTLVAVVNPHRLFADQSECDLCLSVLLGSNGNVVASYPPSVEVPVGVLSMPLRNNALDGAERGMLLNAPVRVAWKRSVLYPFISLTVFGDPSEASLGVNDR